MLNINYTRPEKQTTHTHSCTRCKYTQPPTPTTGRERELCGVFILDSIHNNVCIGSDIIYERISSNNVHKSSQNGFGNLSYNRFTTAAYQITIHKCIYTKLTFTHKQYYTEITTKHSLSRTEAKSKPSQKPKQHERRRGPTKRWQMFWLFFSLFLFCFWFGG